MIPYFQTGSAASLPGACVGVTSGCACVLRHFRVRVSELLPGAHGILGTVWVFKWANVSQRLRALIPTF